MSRSAFRNLAVAMTVVTAGVVALGDGRLDALVTATMSDPGMAGRLAAIAPDRGVDDPNYVNTTEYGFWRIDPE